MIKKITTHIEDAKSRIITQYKGDRGLERMISSSASQIQDLENSVQELYSRLNIDSMSGTQLDLIGTIIGQPRSGQEDIVYRVFLKAKIGVNVSSGTIEDILSVWQILLPNADIELIENFPAEVMITTDAILSDAEAEFIKDFDEILSAGVGFGGVVNYDPENAFAFADDIDDPNTGGFGDYNDSTAGGKLASFL